MPLFFFHLDDGAAASDDEGVELTDVSAARAIALHYLGQSLAEGPNDFWTRGEWRLTVTDENRVELFAVQILSTDVLPVAAEVIPKPTS